MSQRSSAEAMCLATYKTGTDFLTLFNPSKQAEYTSDLRRCYMGTAPSLGVVGRAFGENVAETWLAVQLRDLSEYSGVKGKLNAEQADAAAKVLRSDFGYMKVTEFMHFFQLYKGGKYGRFYGSVDPIAIGEALREYAKDRYDMICKWEAEARRQAEAAEEARHRAEVDEFKAMLRREGLTLQEWIKANCEGANESLGVADALTNGSILH